MRLLIIGDLSGQFGAASKIAVNRGTRVKQVGSIMDALELLRNGQGADLIMMDVNQSVEELIKKLTSERIYIPVVACGFDHHKEKAVNAIRAGAKDYITLPPNEELIAAIFASIAEEVSMIIGNSDIMKPIMNLVDRISPSEANVLVSGESGTGKEVISRYIHQKSKRAGKPFIAINCAAIPENLLESELFGHEKGSFTGAVARRIGKFEEANNGTLLLDEISEIDIKLQAKLLRAIQEKEIERIGGNNTIKLNLRIIATSNRILHKEVEAGNFREDLFFRLNIINVDLPPLRDRKEDILLFSGHFIKKYAALNGLSIPVLSEGAKEFILNYRWPGNIRELENVIHRAVLLAVDNKITKESLMLHNKQEPVLEQRSLDNSLVGRTVDSVEKELIMSTLKHCLGNRTHAANILGISIRTLRNKLNTYSKEGMDLDAHVLMDEE
ncbi:Transcriptional regulatory protein ZraR [Rickettsiales bacterium Ac37b]|nr:Transcriptional regulatory protein ZraR [Rickettsiales bacterium Ac37b]